MKHLWILLLFWFIYLEKMSNDLHISVRAVSFLNRSLAFCPCFSTSSLPLDKFVITLSDCKKRGLNDLWLPSVLKWVLFPLLFIKHTVTVVVASVSVLFLSSSESPGHWWRLGADHLYIHLIYRYVSLDLTISHRWISSYWGKNLYPFLESTLQHDSPLLWTTRGSTLPGL